MNVNTRLGVQTENRVVRTEQDGRSPFPISGISGTILALVFFAEIYIYPLAISFVRGNIGPVNFSISKLINSVELAVFMSDEDL